jgi:glyoxylase-like metal-dependent hydrolase (beta-lactamase superfamily II)
VNVYLLEGEPLTLVDAGPQTEEASEALARGLQQLGYTLADVDQLVITHTHHDHFGLARHVIERSGAIVLSFAENKQRLEDFDNWWDQRMDSLAELVVAQGAPREAVAEIEIIRGFGRYAASVPEVLPVEDNDALQMGGSMWRAIHTPGHTHGHLCLYDPGRELLLSGDHLLKHITSNPVLEAPRLGTTQRPRSLVDYQCSLRRIRELDVSQVLPGHGEPVDDHRPLVDAILSHHEERGRLIQQLLNDRGSTAYELGLALFGTDLPGVELFLVLSEIIGHLELLELQGKVKQIERDGHPVWIAVR